MQKVKKCSKCKQKKLLSQFNKNKAQLDGYCHYCKSCDKIRMIKYKKENPEKCRAVVRRRNRKIKQRAVDYKGGKCQVCSYNKCLAALDFHHINPEEKEFSINARTGHKSWEVIIKELDKCICVCSNCHREIHHYHK